MKRINVEICEKPNSVSWDEIHKILYASHSVNRSKGISQATATLSGNKLKEAVGKGKCFVAMDKDRVVGTCSVKIKEPHTWFAPGKAAYYMFGGVIPEYQGFGIYSALDNARDNYAEQEGVDVIYTFTPEKNISIQKQKLSKGYHLAGFFAPANLDYYSVVLVKWKNPPSLLHIKLRYYYSKVKTLLKHRRKR